MPAPIEVRSIEKRPFTIKVPARHKVTITAKTNAAYRQRVDLTDVLKAEDYVILGQGEFGRIMTIENNEPGSRGVRENAERFVLPTIAHPSERYREFEVACFFSRPGDGEDEWHPSQAWVTGPKDIDPHVDHEWVITTEDGADDDRNDTVLHIWASRD